MHNSGANKLYLVIESAKPDMKHLWSSTSFAPPDGRGGIAPCFETGFSALCEIRNLRGASLPLRRAHRDRVFGRRARAVLAPFTPTEVAPFQTGAKRARRTEIKPGIQPVQLCAFCHDSVILQLKRKTGDRALVNTLQQGNFPYPLGHPHYGSSISNN